MQLVQKCQSLCKVACLLVGADERAIGDVVWLQASLLHLIIHLQGFVKATSRCTRADEAAVRYRVGAAVWVAESCLLHAVEHFESFLPFAGCRAGGDQRTVVSQTVSSSGMQVRAVADCKAGCAAECPLNVVVRMCCNVPVVDGIGLDVNSLGGGHGVENLDGFLYLPVFGARLYQAGESWSSGHERGVNDSLLHLPSPWYGVRNSNFQMVHVAGSLRCSSLSRRIAKAGRVTHTVC